MTRARAPASRSARRLPLRAALAVAMALSACPSRTVDGERRYEPRFGTVAIYAPKSPARGARGLVFLFSDSDGWNDDLERAAQALAAGGVAVIGVDLPQYERGLDAGDDECLYLISEVEDLSKRLQRDLGFAGYRSPILAGIGEGGTLALAALAQSPAATVAGAAAVDPAPALLTNVPLCAGARSEPVPGGGFRYRAEDDLPGWSKVSRHADIPSPPEPEDRLLGLIRDALPPPRATAAPGSAASAAQLAAEAIEDLPLVELPPKRPGRGNTMAIIYSGDGGWRDIDKQIGEELADRGMPVVGVDSLRYFWHEKKPEEIGRDLTQIIAYYIDAWRTPEVLLIGYSFGADILPFAFDHLPAADRARVVQMSLLGASKNAFFEFDVTGWLVGHAAPDAPLVLPEILRLPPRLVQCFYGEDDEGDTACSAPELAATGVEVIRTGGGHHFDGDYSALARVILEGAARRERDTPAGASAATPRPAASP